MNISPQGYQYGEEPVNVNPFWDGEVDVTNIDATAEVNNATGVPSVTVTKSIDGDTLYFNFDFKNLKRTSTLFLLVYLRSKT